MTDDYRAALAQRSQRGNPRGVERLLADARLATYIEPPRPRRRRTTLAVTVAIAVAAVVVIWVRAGGRDLSPTASNADSCIVFARADTPTATLTAIGDEVRVTPGVEHVVFFDQVAAYEEFTELFSQDQAVTDAVNPADLPVSFRFRLPDTTTAGEFVVRVSAIPGVYSTECGLRLDDRGYREPGTAVPTTARSESSDAGSTTTSYR